MNIIVRTFNRLFWIPDDKKFSRLFVFGCIFYVFYAFTNRVQFFEPKLLPLNQWDLFFPFIPWTLLIYLTEIPMMFFGYFHLKETKSRSSYAASFAVVTAISITTFLFFPTTFPRDQFPVLTTEDFWGNALHFFRLHVDMATNCFPSLHVSLCYITAWSFLRESKTRAFFYGIWATLIAVSTLTTKQHYIVDVISGFFLSVGAYWAIGRHIKDLHD